MHQTLGSLIASGDFSGYKTTCASWALDANAIEGLLYGRDYGDWERESAHSSDFYEAEKVTAVEIQTWICTDTNVGLEILCLNGTAIALSWQTGRKSDRQVALLSAEARDLLVNTWEKYRPEAGEGADFVSAESLALPIAAPGEPPFTVDHASPVHHLRLTVNGLLNWKDSLEPEGGLKSVSDVSLLKAAKDAAEREIANRRSSRDRFDDIPEDRKIENASLIAAHKAECEALMAEVDVRLLTPISNRLAQLGVE